MKKQNQFKQPMLIKRYLLIPNSKYHNYSTDISGGLNNLY